MEDLEESVPEKVKSCLESNQLQEALALSEQLVELHPESAKAWFLKGKSFFHLNEFIGASAAFASAIEHGLSGNDRAALDIMQEESKTNQALRVVKRDWYQTDTDVVISVMVKRANKDDVLIEYGDKTLKFSVKVPPTDACYDISLNLAQNIVKEQCVFKVLSSKVEIKLRKAVGGQWNTLEEEADASGLKLKQISEVLPQVNAVPIYPTSSKKAKDWDKLAAEVKQEEKDEKLEGDAALNQLFQQIYGDASEETKRAMNKSFAESNGTVLSTNWSEIGAKKVDMQCPDGMEFKKY